MMDKVLGALSKTASLFRSLTEVGLALLCTTVVLQILFGTQIPFVPVDVVGGIISLTKQLGSEGLVGLAALGVLLALFNKK